MRTIWKGILARGGRTVGTFAAEIVIIEGSAVPVIVENIDAVNRATVAPTTVRQESLLCVIAEIAAGHQKKAG